jgi:hypothetical protein
MGVRVSSPWTPDDARRRAALAPGNHMQAEAQHIAGQDLGDIDLIKESTLRLFFPGRCCHGYSPPLFLASESRVRNNVEASGIRIIKISIPEKLKIILTGALTGTRR